MTMRITRIAAAVLLLSGTANVALACELPPLVAIPGKGAVGDKGPQIQEETDRYFKAMNVYTSCIQAELTAAGGDSAPTIMKAVLVQRNNAAVAEAAEVLKIFNQSIGKADSTAAPAKDGKENGRRRDR